MMHGECTGQTVVKTTKTSWSLIPQRCLRFFRDYFHNNRPMFSNKWSVDRILPANYICIPCRRNIFVTNIFLKLGNLFLASDYVSPNRSVEYTLIFQSLLLQDQKLENRNNQRLYIFKTFLIRMLVKSTSATFKDLLSWMGDWDSRKLTYTIHEICSFGVFYNLTRGKFDNLYWFEMIGN